MQQLMRTVASGLLEVFLVNPPYTGVFVALAQLLAGILAVKTLGAQRLGVNIAQLCRIYNGLASARHAAHHFERYSRLL